MKWPSHGSNPQYLYQELGLSLPLDYIDFSANINPLGPPQVLKEKWADFYNEINDYPDPYGVRLKQLIAKKENVHEDTILLGNGGAELITLIGRLLYGKDVLIVSPTFSEYEKACRVNKCTVHYHLLQEPNWGLSVSDLNLEKMNAVFLCHPNNPTGVQYSYSTILAVLEKCEQNGAYLVIDEAFYDFLEDYIPLTPLLQRYPNLILLRSMTKMYSIPGIRLGYVLANWTVIKKLAGYQPHWSVNSLAMMVGEECLREESFTLHTQTYISQERKVLFSFFEKAGFEYSPSRVNFYLVRDSSLTDQLPLFYFLLKKGIVPRHTFNFPNLEGRWLRFAVKSKEENARLMEVLSEWRQQN
ncbi:threonine-phosphate decarboxylase CobD [Cytobacillus sp. FJAT-54145]|uniref:threonine-phosphate decarboxylase n=1 Tax=Cytobacillus spartinae TaxID=3299023 RepID=A0ABW6KJE3_9BACI